MSDQDDEVAQDRGIDRNNLHEEWLRQATIVEKYTKLEADLELTRDKLKSNLDLKKAQLDEQIRKDPIPFGLKDKPTDPAIDRAIIRNTEFNALLNEYLKAKYDHNVISGIVKAIDHKKSALEHLCWLWAKGYFSTTVSPRLSQDDIGEVTRRVAEEDYFKLRSGK